jgi:hypothetical protein
MGIPASPERPREGTMEPDNECKAPDVIDAGQCQEPGCLAHIDHGDALYRITPKGPGMKFRGMCRAHFKGVIEQPDIAGIIEDSNYGELYT